MSISSNIEDALHNALYVINRFGGICDRHKLCKILYFADKKHLLKWGDTLTDGNYNAYQFGPVPTLTYELIKALDMNGSLIGFKEDVEQYFIKNGKNTLKAVKKSDKEDLSEAAIECIDEAVTEFGNLSFDDITEKSHDIAWEKARASSHYRMHPIEIAKAAGTPKEMLNLIKDRLQTEKAIKKKIFSAKKNLLNTV